MWEAPRNNADWDCFKILTLREILRIQNFLQVEHCAFSEATRLFRQAGCARNKHQFHTVQQNLRLFHWMQVYAWTAFPRLICGICLLMHSTRNRIRDRAMSQHGETRCMAKHPRSDWILSPKHQFPKKILKCPMSTLIPQTRNLLIRKLVCTSLKTTKL